MQSSHPFGYPGALVDVGVTPSSQITVVLPSFSQIASSESGTTAGAADLPGAHRIIRLKRSESVI
jgi:hypothetical protein